MGKKKKSQLASFNAALVNDMVERGTMAYTPSWEDNVLVALEPVGTPYKREEIIQEIRNWTGMYLDEDISSKVSNTLLKLEKEGKVVRLPQHGYWASKEV